MKWYDTTISKRLLKHKVQCLREIANQTDQIFLLGYSQLLVLGIRTLMPPKSMYPLQFVIRNGGESICTVKSPF